MLKKIMYTLTAIALLIFYLYYIGELFFHLLDDHELLHQLKTRN